ncbi:MAG: hypothetical protein ABL888_17750 [Pirellulaceae bacterium]
MFRKLILLTISLLISSCWGYVAAGTVPMSVCACPFCSAVNATFSENIKSNQIVVFAKLTKQPPEIEEDDVALPKAEFEVVTIHKGQEFVTEGMRFKALLVGKYDLGQDFLVMGLDPPAIIWSTPLKANEKLISYIQALKTLPEEGADRLAFFQKYLEHEDPILTYDAYDEFARAKYSDLIALKDRMDRATLIKWISDMEIPVNRRRLYFTMLGVCGNADDALKLEELIRSGDRERQSGLDALTAAYLTLTGDKGMDVIDEHLLSDPKADDLQLLSVKAALTFHAMDKDANVISKDRILKSLRKFLDRPAIADAVLPDLSRMKDWSVLDRVVKLYGELESNFQKVIIIQYLQACPLAEAKAHLEEIKKKDPDTVRRAAFMSDFDFNETDEENKDETDKPKSDDGKGGAADSDDASDKVDGVDKVVVQKVPVEDLVAPNTSSKRLNETAEVNASQPEEGTFTSAPSEPFTPAGVSNDVAEVAQVDRENRSALESVPTQEPQKGSFRLGVVVLTLPMIVSFGVFLLIWSVISGWFERLIF